MPRVVAHWPCGSRSISSTSRPRSARPAASETAVVVFPTPPFWLQMAMTLVFIFLLISIEPLDGGGSVMTVNGFDFGNVFVDHHGMRLAGQPDHAYFPVGKFHAFRNNPSSRNAGDIVMANQDKLS